MKGLSFRVILANVLVCVVSFFYGFFFVNLPIPLEIFIGKLIWKGTLYFVVKFTVKNSFTILIILLYQTIYEITAKLTGRRLNWNAVDA